MDKLPPTCGAFKQYTLSAHLQAAIWAQDMNLTPLTPDPCNLGWVRKGDGLIPILSEAQAAPGAVVELIDGHRGVNWCSDKRTCKSHNLDSSVHRTLC